MIRPLAMTLTCLGLGLCLQAGAVRADSVRLRGEATVPISRVRLADIAELQGSTAEALADLAVGQLQDGQTLEVQIHQVREALTGQNVNWGLLSLGGYARCRVRMEAGAAEVLPATESQTATAIAANPVHEVSLDQAVTLRDHVIAQIAALHQVEADALQIEFDAADNALLQQVTLGERLDVQPTGELGRVLITVRRWRAQELIATYRLTVQVARKAMAVVMRQSITRGQMFTDEHVELAPVLLRDSREDPLQTLDSVIGRMADASLRQGALVYPRAAKHPLMIERNDLVTVRALAGGLAITTTARAMQDGATSDMIQVRNERSREVYLVKVTGRRQATLALTPQVEADTIEGGRP